MANSAAPQINSQITRWSLNASSCVRQTQFSGCSDRDLRPMVEQQRLQAQDGLQGGAGKRLISDPNSLFSPGPDVVN